MRIPEENFVTSTKPVRWGEFLKSHQRGYGHVNVLPHLNSTAIHCAPELVAVLGALLWISGARFAHARVPAGCVFSWALDGFIFHPYKPKLT